MITKELQNKIQLIKIVSKKKASGAFVGGFESAFKGQGIEFEEVREYNVGDDVRSIDWNVTAKMGHPFIKRFTEERELTIFFAIDVSSSLNFKSCKKSKIEIAAEIVSVLAFVAMESNDKTGLMLFSDKIEKTVLPAKGQEHNLRLVRDMLSYPMVETKTSIKNGVDYLHDILQKRSIIFLFSDFIDSDESYLSKLKVLSMKHDLIAINIVDPIEENIPRLGLVKMVDSESGETFLLDTTFKSSRDYFNKVNQERLNNLKSNFNKIGVDYLKLNTNQEWVDKLNNLFLMRGRKN